MRTRVHSPADVASVCERVPRCGPHGELAISWLTAGAKDTPPFVSARRDIPPTLGLGEAHPSLYVLVGIKPGGRPSRSNIDKCASTLVLRVNLENEAVAVKQRAVISH